MMVLERQSFILASKGIKIDHRRIDVGPGMTPNPAATAAQNHRHKVSRIEQGG
jgi:hypothetical protein